MAADDTRLRLMVFPFLVEVVPTRRGPSGSPHEPQEGGATVRISLDVHPVTDRVDVRFCSHAAAN
jgi:hypothetical protein